MFENAGIKIKKLAESVLFVGIVISAIAGAVVLIMEFIIAGLVILVGGPLLCWMGSLLTYGFGELVENSGVLAAQAKGTCGHNRHNHAMKTNTANASDQAADRSAMCSKCGYISSGKAVFCTICGTKLKE